MIHLPKLLMFYGPPGSGKGVQTDLLTAKFDFQVISWGESFREFVQKHADDSTSSDQWRAQRVRECMLDGSAILTEDMMYILEEKITHNLENSDKPIIMDKPGSLPPEAQWLSDFLAGKNISNCLIHFTLSYELAVQRIVSRFYVPSDPKEISYPSYEVAKENCQPGEEPIQREDDGRLESVRHRYYDLYEANRDQVLDTYQSNGFTKILEIEADDTVENIHETIVEFLEKEF
jgi:adenylate kinase